MYLYIDKENLESLIQSRKNKLYDSCIKTIDKHLNVFFNFYKKELRTNEALMNWFQLSTEGLGESNKFTFLDEYVHPQRPIQKNCFIGFSDNKLSAIYLINDINAHTLKQSGAVLVGLPGEEIEIFNRLFLLQNDYDFHKDIKIGSQELSNWSDLSKYSLPLTDIVFVDSYILTDASLVPSNFIKYLEVLCQSSRCSVNVVTYVNNKNIAVNPEELRQLVHESLINVTGHAPSFTLIQYSEQSGVDTLGEHDRTIFTNYIRVKSGDTYNYFYSNGKQKTKGREISYISLAKKDNHNLAKELIMDLQKRIDFLKANGHSFFGDKVSNYLKLS